MLASGDINHAESGEINHTKSKENRQHASDY